MEIRTFLTGLKRAELQNSYGVTILSWFTEGASLEGVNVVP
jgi:hypothetical protein